MRLDGYLAQCAGLSRREAKLAIARGRVRINDNLVKQASTSIGDQDEVTLDQEPVALPGELYLMLNKPAGVLSATTDASQPVVTDLLPEHLARRVHPAGRLDRDTTGLLLLTSNGQWSHKVTAPRHRCPKTYRVSLTEPLDASACRELETGVLLKGETLPTRPATVVPVDQTTVDLTIIEGRYHQVRRMMAAVGNHVAALHRHRIGNVTLDPALAPGQFRALSDAEVRNLEQTGQEDR